MLSIIWSILKIIGIILLVILGLLLAIFLLVLFVPLRYELKGNGSYEKEEGSSPDFLVKARVSWLLRIVCVSIRAGKEGLKMRARLFGIPFLRSGGTKKEKKKRKKAGTQKAEDLLEASVKPEEQHDEKIAADVTSAEMPPEIKSSVPELSSKEPETEGEMLTAQSLDSGNEQTKKGALRRLFEKLRDVIGKIKALFMKIKSAVLGFTGNLRCTFEKICGKIRKMADSAGEIRAFLKAEENREVFRRVAGEGKKLILHILPRKLSGNIIFGLADPAATGQALAVLGILYPVIKERLRVTPVFENRLYLKGDLYLKGRIRVFSLLIILLRIWFDKKFRAMLRRGRELKESISRA